MPLGDLEPVGAAGFQIPDSVAIRMAYATYNTYVEKRDFDVGEE